MGTKPATSEPRSNPFAGKTFGITGTLARRSKEEAQMSIEVRGGKVTGAPSKKTDYVLAGEKAGTKLDKARALGLTVLSEQDFERMIQQAGPITDPISRAIGVGDGQQVGVVGWKKTTLADQVARAALWSGSAVSFVDLTPRGFKNAWAYACARGLQVGWASRSHDLARNRAIL
jgi:hypothetical protein